MTSAPLTPVSWLDDEDAQLDAACATAGVDGDLLARAALGRLDPLETEVVDAALALDPSLGHELDALRELAALAPPAAWRRWLPALRACLTAHEPLRLAPALTFSDTRERPIPLRFDDPRAVGSYVTHDGQCRVRVEHPDWQPGALILAEFLGADQQVRDACFAVLREDYNPSADLIARCDEVEGTQIALHQIRVEELPDDAAEGLRASFARRAVDDVPTREAWSAWARGALGGSLAPRVRETIAGLLEG